MTARPKPEPGLIAKARKGENAKVSEVGRRGTLPNICSGGFAIRPVSGNLGIYCCCLCPMVKQSVHGFTAFELLRDASVLDAVSIP